MLGVGAARAINCFRLHPVFARFCLKVRSNDAILVLNPSLLSTLTMSLPQPVPPSWKVSKRADFLHSERVIHDMCIC